MFPSPKREPNPYAAAAAHTLPLQVRMALHVGVLHYSPSLEPFPLLADPSTYEPNTLDMSNEKYSPFWNHILDWMEREVKI